MHSKRIFPFPLLLIVGLAQAQDTGSAVQACGKEEDNARRLVCFDALVKQLNKPDLKAMAPQQAMTGEDAQGSGAVDNNMVDFGLEHKKANKVSEDKLYGQVSVIEKDHYKNLIITLNNGQVWKQTEAMHFKVKVNDSIYVARGALGSFFLGMADNNRRIRVKRIK